MGMEELKPICGGPCWFFREEINKGKNPEMEMEAIH